MKDNNKWLINFNYLLANNFIPFGVSIMNCNAYYNNIKIIITKRIWLNCWNSGEITHKNKKCLKKYFFVKNKDKSSRNFKLQYRISNNKKSFNWID